VSYPIFLSTRSLTHACHSSVVRPLSRATTTTVMLSHPIPADSESRAIHLTIMSSAILPRSSPLAIARRVKSTTCCELKQSQIPTGQRYAPISDQSNIPSQATTKNSSSPSSLCVMISGSTVTICFSALNA